MVHIVENRVRENALANGLNSFQLQGAVSGRQRFRESDRPGGGTAQSGDTFWYVCVQDPLYEIGLGTLTLGTPDTLSRDTVLESSNADSAVSFNNASATVFSAIPSQHLFYTDPSGAIGDPSPLRAATFRDLAATLKAELGLEDNELAFIAGGTAEGDGLGGLFRWDNADVTAADEIDKLVNVNTGTGRHNRVPIKVAPTSRGNVIASGGTLEVVPAGTLGAKWFVEAHSEGDSDDQLSGYIIGDAAAPAARGIDSTGDLDFDISGTSVRIINNSGGNLTVGYTVERIS